MTWQHKRGCQLCLGSKPAQKPRSQSQQLAGGRQARNVRPPSAAAYLNWRHRSDKRETPHDDSVMRSSGCLCKTVAKGQTRGKLRPAFMQQAAGPHVHTCTSHMLLRPHSEA